jgi:hypothetical protein
MDMVDARSVDRDEAADWRMSTLDRPCADTGDADEYQEKRKNEGEGGKEKVHENQYAAAAIAVSPFIAVGGLF